MFDHVSLRVSDLPIAAGALGAGLRELGIKQTADSPSFAGWGNFLLSVRNDERPITQRLHVAFVAKAQDDVDRYWQAGVDAGLVDDGRAGPRPDYADDYYAAFLKDANGNSFEAVHRDGERPRGKIDHVVIRVADVEASTSFYETVGAAAGLTIRRQGADSTAFSVGGPGGTFIVKADDPTEHAHIAFSGDEDAVRRFHGDAVAAGHRSNGEPGERADYHDGYYAAFVLDPDGNNIEVVDHHRS
jgi:catechol 2,3-dioxygenase-like lactoylglutathione lyase family enzyme